MCTHTHTHTHTLGPQGGPSAPLAPQIFEFHRRVQEIKTRGKWILLPIISYRWFSEGLPYFCIYYFYAFSAYISKLFESDPYIYTQNYSGRSPL